MTPKGRLITFATVSVLLAGGAGAMIYLQKEEITENLASSERIKSEITVARTLLRGTPDLIKEVIIQRETDSVIREILSDEEDVTNFVRTVHEFGESSGIAITKVSPQRRANSRKSKEDFDRVGYSLDFEGTAWELLDFLDRVESHSRFMSVTSFSLSAARRTSFKDGAEPRHRISLDLETYRYEPNVGGKEVRIDGYDHKRELLISEISRRASDLQIETYHYSGPRRRRDPWIDPRMPVDAEGETMPIPDQLALVEDLVAEVATALALREAYENAETIIEEMKARAQLEEVLTRIEEQARRIRADNLLSFVSAEQQFQGDVENVAIELRAWLNGEASSTAGPDLNELTQTRDVIGRHIARQEYELARDAYAAIEPRLRGVPLGDEPRRVLVAAMEQASTTIERVLEFEAITIDIGGVAIHEGRRPVALINGQPFAEGELLSGDLVVRSITAAQIEFAYRGLVLAKSVESTQSSPRE
ncbi:MAG: Tfp pilus assembly protein PilO [Planctomycetota bacterium]|jgi:Tfp pilus assembly protein PilO